MRIVLPNTFCGPFDPRYGPFFFLAGPVQGGDDWQTKCCEEIQKRVPHFYAALPNHYREDHPLMRFKVADTGGRIFGSQLEWERCYLEIAAKYGCIIFWLPCESRKNPRNDGLPYAMDTRGELGEWRGRMMSTRVDRKPPKVIVGAEEGFLGIRTIQRNFSLAFGWDYPIFPTLASTVKAAVNIEQY